MNLANIPMELKKTAQWLIWRYEQRGGNRTKIPYSARTGQPAKWQDPKSWTAFGEAVYMLRDKQWDGIGFVLTRENPWTGVDLDHCLSRDTGEIDEAAFAVVRHLSSYTEITPSGTGLHIFCRAKLPEGRRRAGAFEMYDSDRFLTMTGDVLPGAPLSIEDRQAEIDVLHAATFPPEPARPAMAPVAAAAVSLPDDRLVIEKVTRDPHYQALWSGDASAYSSQSEADLALAGRIGFFAGWQPAEVERLFRASGLYRDKWDSRRGATTYGQMTAARACSGVRDSYRWDRNGAQNPSSVVSVVNPNGECPPKTASVVSVVRSLGRKPAKMPEKLAPEAYHGLPGMVMRILAPHTEGHPAGILGAFLAEGGCALGPGPYVYRDGSRHACNEFGLLIGVTGSGRKGTASRRVDEILSSIDDIDSTISLSHDMRESENTGFTTLRPNDRYDLSSEKGSWWRRLILRGLGSGEALVSALAEEQEGGGHDPRRIVVETEFARCLKVMARDGSTLSDMLKAAWDGEPLHVRTKGQVLRAETSHVSILGHVTPEEIRARLAHVELFNGFANRFLWMATRRVGSLPFGGGRAPIAPIVSAMRAALVMARDRGEMEFDAAAKELWDPGGIYEALNDRPPGLLGAVTDRASAHVTRISLQYALWDGALEIGVPHLMAGLAVWDYSEKTCEYLFGRSTGDTTADTILEKLTEVYPGCLTRKEIRDLFGRNAPPGRIPAALALLEERGLARAAKQETGGHPAEVWVVQDKDGDDRNDLTPLEKARRLIKTDEKDDENDQSGAEQQAE